MKQSTVIGLASVLALALGLWVAVTIAPPSQYEPEYLQQYPAPRALPDFSLYDQDGDVFTNERLSGHWTLAFVGYTFCPDICPTTLAEIKGIYPELTDVASEHPLQVWFLSVDPKRDTQARLKEYINFFNPSFIATSGEHAQLFPLVRSMGMMYAMADNSSDPNYLVDHSASVVVINPDGQVIGRFKPELAPGKLAISDGQQILADMPGLLTL